MKPKERRINNLKFRSASYLKDPPKNPDWDIVKFVPNGYYGNEDKFTYHKEGYYTDPKWEAEGIHCRIDKGCFKNPETCYVIASFELDSHEPCWELKFCGNRPMYLNEEERKDFWELVEWGYNELDGYYDNELGEI